MVELLPPLDLRAPGAGLLEGLSELQDHQARVLKSRHPLRVELEGFTAWPLVNGPSAYYYLVHTPLPLAEPVLEVVREQHRQIVALYREAMALGSDGAAFEQLLSRHMDTEERTLYPLYQQIVQEERLIRELGYEHLGLRRGLPEFGPFLRKIAAGETSKRDKDGFDIRFFHLFEHHMEREEESLLPVLEHLCPGEAAQAARQFTSAS